MLLFTCYIYIIITQSYRYCKCYTRKRVATLHVLRWFNNGDQMQRDEVTLLAHVSYRITSQYIYIQITRQQQHTRHVSRPDQRTADDTQRSSQHQPAIGRTLQPSPGKRQTVSRFPNKRPGGGVNQIHFLLGGYGLK